MPCHCRLLTTVALVTVVALAAGVAPAGAQPEIPRFEVAPRLGGLIPVVDLGKSFDPAELVQVRVDLDPAVTGGLAVQYNPRAWPVSFRAAFDYTPLNTEAQAQPAVCVVLTGPGCRVVGTDARYMVLTGDVLVRAVKANESHLYFLLGLGIKRYDFADLICATDDVVCLLLDEFAQDQTNISLHLGLGLNFRVGPVRSQLEVADYMSRYRPPGLDSSGEVQQDLLLTVGFRLGVG